ncbi:hypothetical protein FSARC_8346 [Fusarium sarcochroum]|uniref:DUF202 domain-containing protein n=1 Tax=Fusarium sarcochroum TaxID=1208366 RepID=A0A8H4TT90_9HYPO|nr:hypothetical protein FSARC_8346 [Fusarium sarcochroum]
MLRSTISRSNSEYSLQDLTNRPRSPLRHCQHWNENNTDSGPQNSSTSEPSEPRAEGSAVPPADGAAPDKSRTWLGRFWGEHVCCEVDFSAARDHLANERTFLGYLRTSVMMSMVGTLVAQLFTLHHEGYHAGFGYFVTGRPLAMTCYAFSIGTILLGAIRTWRHQSFMRNGKALVGGFEIHLLGMCSMVLLLVFFAFLLTIDVIKETDPDNTEST